MSTVPYAEFLARRAQANYRQALRNLTTLDAGEHQELSLLDGADG